MFTSGRHNTGPKTVPALGRIMYASHELAHALGYPWEELQGVALAELLPPTTSLFHSFYLRAVRTPGWLYVPSLPVCACGGACAAVRP